jgi:hypothetical protein
MRKPILIYVKKLPFNYSGLSIYPLIIIQQDKKSIKLLRHEYIHYQQAKRDGFLIFWIRYILLNILIGYSLNPYELEAKGQIKAQIKTKLIK